MVHPVTQAKDNIQLPSTRPKWTDSSLATCHGSAIIERQETARFIQGTHHQRWQHANSGPTPAWSQKNVNLLQDEKAVPLNCWRKASMGCECSEGPSPTPRKLLNLLLERVWFLRLFHMPKADSYTSTPWFPISKPCVETQLRDFHVTSCSLNPALTFAEDSSKGKKKSGMLELSLFPLSHLLL